MSDLVLPADLGAEIRDLKRRLTNLERSPRLTSAAVRDGAIRILNASDEEVGRFGLQEDGGYGINLIDGSLTIEGANVDAIWADTKFDSSDNQSLTTTPTTVVSVSLTVPDWCTKAFVFVGFNAQMTNWGSGASQLLQARIDVGGVVLITADTLVADFDIRNINPVSSRTINDPGSTISVEGKAFLDAGTNSANKFQLSSMGIFLRS